MSKLTFSTQEEKDEAVKIALIALEEAKKAEVVK